MKRLSIIVVFAGVLIASPFSHLSLADQGEATPVASSESIWTPTPLDDVTVLFLASRRVLPPYLWDRERRAPHIWELEDRPPYPWDPGALVPPSVLLEAESKDDPQPSYPTNATLKWQLSVPGRSGGLALSPDGSTLYIGGDRALVAVDLAAVDPENPNYPDATCFARWVTNCYYPYAPSVGINGTVYVGCGYDTLVALSPVDGSPIWCFNDPQQSYWSFVTPATIGLDNVVFVGAGTNVYALTNGSVKWFYPYPPGLGVLSRSQHYPFLPLGPDGTLYVNTPMGRLFALDSSDGSFKWITSALTNVPYGPHHTCAPALGSDGTVYYGCLNYVFAVNPATGTYRWVFDAGSSYEFSRSPVVASDGTLYIQQLNSYVNRLFAFGTNGAPQWTNVLSGLALGLADGPNAVASDGELYAVGNDGIVYSFSPDGTTNWTYETGGDLLLAPLLGPDGTLYVSSCSQACVFAFQGSPPACSSWPQYGKNARRAAVTVPTASAGHLSSPGMTSSGFRFEVSAPTNMPECICASRNLVSWTNLGQVVVTNGAVFFVDTEATNNQYRFYRALAQ